MLLFVQSKFKCLRNPNVITCLICIQDPVKSKHYMYSYTSKALRWLWYFLLKLLLQITLNRSEKKGSPQEA